MHVLLAPDSFKGSLTAQQVARHLARGVRRAYPGATCTEIPIADGGEGTVAAAVSAGATPVEVEVSGALGAPVRARYALRGSHAVIEMSAAAGLDQVQPDPDTARVAGTEGVGELILHALDGGATDILLGLGGSATTDGGAGLVCALGVHLWDGAGRPMESGGAALTRLARVDLSRLDPRIALTRVVVAADVRNPLLGPAGAAATFGPQKGADAEAVADLEAGLTQWITALDDAGVPWVQHYAAAAGAGAGGGVGFAALALLGAQLRPGIDEVLAMVGFAEAVRDADVVITGEGSLDAQSLAGKAPFGVAAAAAALGVPVLMVVGRCAVDSEVLRAHGISAARALADLEPNLQRCLANAGELTEQAAADAIRVWRA